MECLFCQIAARTLPADIIHEDSETVAFRDLNPQAPHHLLIVPKKHISTPNDMAEADRATVGHMMLTAARLAKTLGLAEAGFRLVMNCNADGGQSVFHIHVHLLGGRKMKWPPG